MRTLETGAMDNKKKGETKRPLQRKQRLHWQKRKIKALGSGR